ncbi:uncharacterized protein BYT42DRAFT_629532 [Radiomyces spectabilis]|uniref:uncharacterized protein n=1 Tax=Radiomyces spectabilis TaxID=64574 RepID=UPI00221E6C54|nr:uncharacterized protein BYT42DRAFT_629532 [Radiomyces spectabilis]KAI8391681.1 hypothetical protein BYT42DRAFT_629532 [Radiomyces spectabilis]
MVYWVCKKCDGARISLCTLCINYGHLSVAWETEMSRSTSDRRMKELGFSAYSPARILEQWRSVIWSDESRFRMNGNDGCIRVIRKANERYLE